MVQNTGIGLADLGLGARLKVSRAWSSNVSVSVQDVSSPAEDRNSTVYVLLSGHYETSIYRSIRLLSQQYYSFLISTSRDDLSHQIHRPFGYVDPIPSDSDLVARLHFFLRKLQNRLDHSNIVL